MVPAMSRLSATLVLVAVLLAWPHRHLWADEPEPPFRTTALAQAVDETKRPAVLPILYVSLGAAGALDVYSTTLAFKAGAREANPLMGPFAGRPAAAMAVKAVATATTIFFVERLWKRNRTAAIVTLVAVSGATAGVAARNFRYLGGR